jgi:hypothetical protein
MGRLKPGVTIAKAQTLFDGISYNRPENLTLRTKAFSVRVLPEKLARPIPYANNTFILISALFLALSAIVLLLACTNIANILMACEPMREMGALDA